MKKKLVYLWIKKVKNIILIIKAYEDDLGYD